MSGRIGHVGMYPRMLDLCSGLGGASAAMRERGWKVVTVDIEERFRPSVIADICHLPINGYFDLIWASVPCTEYTKKYLETHGRLYKDVPDPNLSRWQAAEKSIANLKPRFWIMENVQGAVRYHGKPTIRYGSRLLWTNIPLLMEIPYSKYMSKVGKYRTGNPYSAEWKSRIPYAISEGIALTVESYLGVTP